jgi:multicomponent Na+:H+ antiporter subunit B
MSSNDTRPLYVESPIIMTTVRVVAPFVLTFGLFIMLHGADSPGGGFQGGVVAAAVVVMTAFAYGIDATREWVDARAVASLMAVGVLTFAGIGLGTMALDGNFLEYHSYDVFIDHSTAYGIELVELAIGAIVAGVVVGLFFVLSAGFGPAADDGGEDT